MQVRWDRALDLAVQNKTHIDTVLYRRGKWLAAFGAAEESDPKFQQIGRTVQVDEATILAKVAQEAEKEAQRPGAKRYVDPIEH